MNLSSLNEEWTMKFAINLAEEVRKVAPGSIIDSIGVGDSILISVADDHKITQTFISFPGQITAERHLFIRDTALKEYAKKYPKLERKMMANKHSMDEAAANGITNICGNLYFVSVECEEFEIQNPSSVGELITFILHDISK